LFVICDKAHPSTLRNKVETMRSLKWEFEELELPWQGERLQGILKTGEKGQMVSLESETMIDNMLLRLHFSHLLFCPVLAFPRESTK
jgi:hypothetical protein